MFSFVPQTRLQYIEMLSQSDGQLILTIIEFREQIETEKMQVYKWWQLIKKINRWANIHMLLTCIDGCKKELELRESRRSLEKVLAENAALEKRIKHLQES